MPQLSLSDDMGTPRILSSDIFDYRAGLLTPDECVHFLHEFIHTVPWEQRRVMMYGREVLTPRLTAWYGEAADYPAHDRPLAHLWTAGLLDIRARTELLAGTTFDAVLLNYYRDQNDSVSWHDDEDRTPGKNRIVASVSIGAERVFDIRLKADHRQKTSILLQNGSYLLMKGDFQSKYEHRIAKTTKATGPRINLTFRQLML
ncbi:MAG: alpha-ketoglutarate-dependent dioxygenase AlkB [Bacteroidetes bacterium]|nr:alpha-ketoglutarate-dependent dioxygenase AlkB [Bacteroidota bacterium]